MVNRFLLVLAALFLCVEWGPLSAERSKWGIAGGHPFVKEVALTFDDGPRERGMPELLAALDEADAHCTFFLVGKFAERYGPTTRAVYEAGHEIANHTYTHPALYRLWVEKIMLETSRCNDVMDALAVRTPRFMRPPGGGFNLKIFYAARRMDMKLGLWSVNTADYSGRSVREIVKKVVGSVKPGSIVLMHSGVPATVEALPAIAAALRERGFRFVTLQEMYDGGVM